MTDHSPIADITGPPTDLTTRNLTAEKRRLVELMGEYQFGRIENMLVRAGQPILDGELRIVRIARFGGVSIAAKRSVSDDFELKRTFLDLFDALEQLNNGMVVKLEFRHGLPFLLEAFAP
jgi:hypothetical protein